MLLVHCQVSAPAFAQRPFPFELEKSMRQQPLSAEDPILAKGQTYVQSTSTSNHRLLGPPTKFTTLSSNNATVGTPIHDT